MTAPPSTVTDALVMLYAALSADQQAVAFARISRLHLDRIATDSSEAGRMLRSLLRVAEKLGHNPSVEEYKTVSRQLIADGEDVATFSRLYAFYGSSWRLAHEAMDLSLVTTPRRIEARFRSRRVAKVFRYSDQALHDALKRAETHWEHVPSHAEFTWWRDLQIELAKANGEELHIPCAASYRTRWGSWEGGLLHFGYTPEQVTELVGVRKPVLKPGEEPFVPDDAAIAELRVPDADGKHLTVDELQRLTDAYRRLPRRSQYVLTARLGLVRKRALQREVARPLLLSVGRVHQLLTLALSALGDAVAPTDPSRALEVLPIIAAELQQLAVPGP